MWPRGGLCLSSVLHFGASLKIPFGKQAVIAKGIKREGGEFLKLLVCCLIVYNTFPLSPLNLQQVFFLCDLFSEKEAKFREVTKCVHCHTVNDRART